MPRLPRSSTLLMMLAVLLVATASPAVAHLDTGDSRASGDGSDSHLDDPREGLIEVGFDPLNDKSFNSDIWAWTSPDDRVRDERDVGHPVDGRWDRRLSLGR